MKNLGIILSICFLMLFTVACMKQEKDVFKAAEAEGRKNGTPIVLQEGGKDEIMAGGSGSGGSLPISCGAPSNLVTSLATPGFTTFSWTPPANFTPSFYLVKLYGNLTITTTTTTNSIILPTPNLDYTIEIQSSCGGGLYSAPYNWSPNPGNTGGTTVIIADNLDNFTAPIIHQATQARRGIFNGFMYEYSLAQSGTSSFSVNANSCYNFSNNTNLLPIPAVSITPVSGQYSTFDVVIPNPLSSIRNTDCQNDNKYLLDMTIAGTNGIASNVVIGYKELNATPAASWNAIYCWGNSSYTGGRTITLKRGKTYRIKFLSIYSFPNVLAPSPCASAT